MGAAVAWEPAGQHVASVALDGTIVVMVRSCAEPCMQCVFAELPVWHHRCNGAQLCRAVHALCLCRAACVAPSL